MPFWLVFLILMVYLTLKFSKVCLFLFCRLHCFSFWSILIDVLLKNFYFFFQNFSITLNFPELQLSVISLLLARTLLPVPQGYVPPKGDSCAGILSGHRRSTARSLWIGSFSRTWYRWTWRYLDDWIGSWWSPRSGSRVCTTVRPAWSAASFPVPLRDWACCRRRTSPRRWSYPFSAAKSVNSFVRFCITKYFPKINLIFFGKICVVLCNNHQIVLDESSGQL